AIEDDVLLASRPALLCDVDAVDERDADEVCLTEVVPCEGVRRALRVEAIGAAAPRPSIEADVDDTAREVAVDELSSEGLPRVDLRVVERTALETRLTRSHAREVGPLEAAVA